MTSSALVTNNGNKQYGLLSKKQEPTSKSVKKYHAHVEQLTKDYIYSVIDKSDDRMQHFIPQLGKNKIKPNRNLKGNWKNTIKSDGDLSIMAFLFLGFAVFAMVCLGVIFSSETSEGEKVFLIIFLSVLLCGPIGLLKRMYKHNKFIVQTGYEPNVFSEIRSSVSKTFSIGENAIYRTSYNRYEDTVTHEKYDYREINYIRFDIKNDIKIIEAIDFYGSKFFSFHCDETNDFDTVFSYIEKKISNTKMKLAESQNKELANVI